MASPENHTAASLLSPECCFLPSPAPSGARGWSSGWRPEKHSHVLRGGTILAWKQEKNTVLKKLAHFNWSKGVQCGTVWITFQMWTKLKTLIPAVSAEQLGEGLVFHLCPEGSRRFLEVSHSHVPIILNTSYRPYVWFVEVSKGFWRFQKVSEGFRWFLEGPESFWRFQKVYGGSRWFLEGLGRFLEVPEGFRRFLKVSGGFRRSWKVSGGFWRFPKVLEGFWTFQKVLQAHM